MFLDSLFFFSFFLFFFFFCVLHTNRPGLAFPFCFASLGGLHVEHFKDGYSLTATGRAHSVRLLFFMSFLGGGAHESSMAMPLVTFARLFLSTRTGIECQQDMLGDGDSSKIHASGMSV